MKKITLFAFLTLSCINIKAQYLSDGSDQDPLSWNKEMDAIRAKRVKNHITEMKIFSFKSDSSNTKGKLRSVQKFDSKGNLAEYTVFNRRGIIKLEYLYLYDDKNQLIQLTQLKRNGKLELAIRYAYNDQGDNTEMTWYWRNSHYSHKIATFNANHQPLEVIYRYDNDKKLGSRYVYSYYEDGSKKQTVQYDDKGKVKYTWNFDCNPVGKLTSSHLKDTSKTCIRYELDKNGKKMKVVEEFKKLGLVVRIIKKYDSENNWVEEIRYDKKGREGYHMNADYNDKNQCVMYSYTEQGLGHNYILKFIYSYDDKGNVAEELGYKIRKGKETLKYIQKFSYVMAGK
jgi:hypothetical protein